MRKPFHSVVTEESGRPRKRRAAAGGFGLVLAAAALLAAAPAGGAAAAGQAGAESKTTGSEAMHELPSTLIRHYGYLPDGSEVTLATLRNANGIEVDVISYGGIITRLLTPDAEGRPGNIVLGLDNLDEYVESNPYFGALIGRYGNRIARGRFAIDGETYQLETNDGENHLHGGVQGFDKKNWTMTPFVTRRSAGLVLELESPDGDQGYPGTLRTRVVYELSNDDALDFHFQAVTDRPTIVNLTQHSYFNLDGEGDILDHRLMIPAERFTPVDQGLIPTGELRDVAGTPFDFREPKPIGRDIGADNEQLQRGLGYDHNFVLKSEASDDLILAARVTGPDSGRVLEVWTEEPGVQFYSGNFLDGSLDGTGVTHGHRTGFCLEPQHFPDSPNRPDFPSTVLRPGETYDTRIIYRFTTVE